ncbi:metallophosphoesterase [Sphingomonas sp. AAP5]|uniref:metallophosphoesterase family protein n=1 Tax=Sphingomonas sp. AAP5 TaxID=1523415 RepID=UPI0010570DC1|nr:metallophosphoesterase [Sphingomonas sp. AAP5]QBM74586.1 metallophosphoesterase [Sphingomonas sp. AAP5]
MMRLFHVSDVHFGREDAAAVAWFGGLVKAEQPDAVIMTGDLTMRARRREFSAGLAWLQGLGVPVTVEVGNHDLPYFNPIDRFFRPYRRMSKIERMVEQPLDLPGVAIVPLVTTARAQWRLNWSKGKVSRGALDRTLALLAEVPAGKLVFIACHHPLIEPETRMSAQTHNGAAALRALADAGADAVLTGHVHDPFDIAHSVDGTVVRMIGAGTLSERTRTTPPSFNEIRIADGRFDVLLRTMTPAPDRPLERERAE